MEKVNINKADEKELQKIIHIGPVRAKVIVFKREYHNHSFRDAYEMSTILGLGEIRMKDIINQNVAEV